jgi:hypothetical protein
MLSLQEKYIYVYTLQIPASCKRRNFSYILFVTEQKKNRNTSHFPWKKKYKKYSSQNLYKIVTTNAKVREMGCCSEKGV